MLQEGKPVSRRVLYLSDNETCVTVDPDMSADDYVFALMHKCQVYWISACFLLMVLLIMFLRATNARQGRDKPL